MFGRIISALSTRRCRGCGDAGYHNAHLTMLGRRRFTRKNHTADA